MSNVRAMSSPFLTEMAAVGGLSGALRAGKSFTDGTSLPGSFVHGLVEGAVFRVLDKMHEDTLQEEPVDLSTVSLQGKVSAAFSLIKEGKVIPSEGLIKALTPLFLKVAISSFFGKSASNIAFGVSGRGPTEEIFNPLLVLNLLRVLNDQLARRAALPQTPLFESQSQ